MGQNRQHMNTERDVEKYIAPGTSQLHRVTTKIDKYQQVHRK